MLICPSCHFENTDRHRLCQQCGQSLQTWFALCFPLPTNHQPVTVGPYLDAAQRYRLSAFPATLPVAKPIKLLVIDHRPEEPSPLRDLQTAWLENPQLNPKQLPQTDTIPAQAFPYLALQTDYFPAVPEIQDAFYNQSHAILLIEDRSHWSLLQTRWCQGQDGLLQEIQWLFEMALLWEALAPWQMENSLLHKDRLALNPTDLLCLTHLEQAPNNSPLPLKTLGQLWQHLFLEGYPQSKAVVLSKIFDGLNSGRVSTIAQLKADLADLADHFTTDRRATVIDHAPSPPLNSMSSSGNPSNLNPVPQTAAEVTDPSHPSRHQPLDPRTKHQNIGSGSEESIDDKSDPPEVPTMVLPMKLVQVDEVGQTHVGMQRNHNEDCFFAQTASIKIDTVSGATLNSKGLYIVCDGMGGHASGEIASQLAVKTLSEFFDRHWQQELPDQATLAKAVLDANQAIYDTNQASSRSGLGRMGTTLVMLLIHNLKAAVVHVGDSRLYSYCKRLGLRQLTLDHEVGQREISRGIEPAIAYARPDAYQLTQALGPRHRDEVKPTITYQDISEDTLFILCSDGLSDNDLLENYEDSHIAPLLSSKANLEAGLAELIDLANDQNGHDNITVVLTRLKLRPDMTNLPK